MGCDIHTLVQVKKDNKWEDLENDLYTDRNYKLFSILAGVRGNEDPIAYPRGFPSDFELDKDDDENHNGHYMGDHSFSYLTLTELLENKERLKEADCDFVETLEILQDRSIGFGGMDNVRLVFGFDS